MKLIINKTDMEQQVKQVKYEIDNYKLSNLQFMHMNAQKKVH